MTKKLSKKYVNEPIYEGTADHAICPELLMPFIEHFLGNPESIATLKNQLNKDGMVPLMHKGKHAGYMTNKNIK